MTTPQQTTATNAPTVPMYLEILSTYLPEQRQVINALNLRIHDLKGRGYISEEEITHLRLACSSNPYHPPDIERILNEIKLCKSQSLPYDAKKAIDMVITGYRAALQLCFKCRKERRIIGDKDNFGSKCRALADPTNRCGCGKETKIRGEQEGSNCKRKRERQQIADKIKPARDYLKSKKRTEQFQAKKVTELSIAITKVNDMKTSITTKTVEIEKLERTISQLNADQPANKLPTCTICLEELSTFAGYNRDTRCTPVVHTFHTTCLDLYVASGGKTCPNCRQEM